MSATFNWVISTLERDLQPEDMDGAVIVAHWRCNASQTTTQLPATALVASALTRLAQRMYPMQMLPKNWHCPAASLMG